MNISVCFVVTNFNNTEFTEKMVDSIVACGIDDYKIIVVDNNSKFSEKEKLVILNKKHPSVVYPIFNIQNVGYFQGLNIGLNFARKEFTKPSVFVVGNNDLEFSPDFGRQLENCMNVFTKYPVVSPNIVLLDGSPQNPHVISHISKFRELIYDIYHSSYFLAILILKFAKITKHFTARKDELLHNIAQEIYQGYGACYLIGPLFFSNFDQLWAPAFLMYEEFFLSRQLQEKGFRIFYQPNIMVKHHCHASTNLLPSYSKWLLSKKAHKEYRKHVKIF